MDSDYFPNNFRNKANYIRKKELKNSGISPSKRSNKLSADAITRKYSHNFRPRNSVCNGLDSRSPTEKYSTTRENGFKEQEKGVKFSSVTIYSFAREQGFSSIPDSGWCTLGMAQKHFTVSRFDLHQHRLLQRLRRRQRRILSQKNRFANGTINGKIRCRGKPKFKSQQGGSEFSAMNPGDSCRVPIFSSPPPLSPQTNHDRFSHIDPSDSPLIALGIRAQATPPPPCLSPPSPRRFLGSVDDSLVNSSSFVSFDSLDTDSEASLDQTPSISSPGRLRNGRTREKLMPIHSAARIRLLRSSGVTQLDESERLVCSFVRATRARVGCSCGPKFPCVPERCSCAKDGVPCQVDRESFPCSCLANKCCNPNGRNEFLRGQVRAHAQHVLTRFSKNASPRSESPVGELAPTPSCDSPASITSPIPNLPIDALSTPSGACPICVMLPVSLPEKMASLELPSSNCRITPGLVRVTNNGNHSRSVRTPLQKRKSEYPSSPDCAHSTPLPHSDTSMQVGMPPPKINKTNESIELNHSPMNSLDACTDIKLNFSERPRSPLVHSAEIQSSPTRAGLRERTGTPSKESGVINTPVRVDDSLVVPPSPSFSGGQYVDPDLGTTQSSSDTSCILTPAIRRITAGSRKKSQSFSEFSEVSPSPSSPPPPSSSSKSRNTRMRKSSSAEDLQASDLYILTNNSEFYSDYPGTPPILLECESPVPDSEFHNRLRVNFTEDPNVVHHHHGLSKAVCSISKSDYSKMSDTRIWPPTQSTEDLACIWDDSELIADYEAIEAQFKQKVNEAWYNRENSKRIARKDKTNRSNGHTRKQDRRSDRRTQELIDEHQVDTIQPTMDVDIDRICPFRYLPPLTSVPDFVFASYPPVDHDINSIRNMPNLGPQFYEITSSTCSAARSLSDWEPVLQAWYQAGYSLGRVHGLKLRSKMKNK